MEDIDFSKFSKGIFMINLVAIVYNPDIKKMIIGRREQDQFVPELTWSFPGGRPTYDRDLEDSLKDEIKKKTGLEAEIKKIIFARITPELNGKQIIIYYYCETSQNKAKAGEKFSEVKWILPKEYKEYFKTSIHPEIRGFLKGLG